MISVSGPRSALENVLLALLLPLSPPSEAATGRFPVGAAAFLELSQSAVTAANNKLSALLQEVPKPDLLLTETVLDLLVDPQKTREGLIRELRRAPVDQKLLIAWRDSLWRRMALQATFEVRQTDAAVVCLPGDPAADRHNETETQAPTHGETEPHRSTSIHRDRPLDKVLTLFAHLLLPCFRPALSSGKHHGGSRCEHYLSRPLNFEAIRARSCVRYCICCLSLSLSLPSFVSWLCR